MEEVKRPVGEALFRAPLLKWCPICGGIADYRYAEDGRLVHVECTRCGLRTPDMLYAWAAGERWNRRITEGARLLSLHMLLNSEFGMEGDGGGTAVWIERDDNTLKPAILKVGLDLGEMEVLETDADGEQWDWTLNWINAEGRRWRIWDRKPTAWDRVNAKWDGESWRPARAMPKLFEGEGEEACKAD